MDFFLIYNQICEIIVLFCIMLTSGDGMSSYVVYKVITKVAA